MTQSVTMPACGIQQMKIHVEDKLLNDITTQYT